MTLVSVPDVMLALQANVSEHLEYQSLLAHVAETARRRGDITPTELVKRLNKLVEETRGVRASQIMFVDNRRLQPMARYLRGCNNKVGNEETLRDLISGLGIQLGDEHKGVRMFSAQELPVVEELSNEETC